jgi:ankyrin repeat protein
LNSELLIVYGADVNATPRVHGAALIAAIKGQNSILVWLLVGHAADLDQDGELCRRYTALNAAVRTGNSGVVALLKQLQAAIGKANDSRRSRLVSEAAHGKGDNLSSLLSQDHISNCNGEGRLQLIFGRPLKISFTTMAAISSESREYGNKLGKMNKAITSA